MSDPRAFMSPALRRMAGSLPPDVLAAVALNQEAELDRQAMRLLTASPMERELFLAALRAQKSRTTVTLQDGTTGYLEPHDRTDRCFGAALATLLQVPLHEVPDPRPDERLRAGEDAEEINRSAWQQLGEWLAKRALRIVHHQTPPWDAERWLGVVRFPGFFMDHALVMTRRTILFDPVDRTRHSRPVRAYAVSDVAYGYTFQRLTQGE